MKKQATDKEKFIWNMLGSISNAFSTLILSISVNRILGGESGGIFSFAYSNAQLMLTIGGFEVRPYQSTDIENKYSFNSYFTFRLLSCLLMVIVSVIYILAGDFNKEKSIVLLMLVLFKMVEAFTDVFAGRFQQRDRIDISGKLFFIRVVMSTAIFIIIVLLSGSLIIASAGMFIMSLALFFINDSRYIFEDDRKNISIEKGSILNIFKYVFPLFIGAFVMMYIINAPKYAINNIYGDNMQNIYNILFMPAFVINLFSMFIFRPMLVSMTIDWNNRNLVKLWKSIFKMNGIILGFTAVTLAATWFLGIPVLSFMYNINLSSYREELMLVMLSGGISALMTFSYYIITIMRQQKLLVIGYGMALVYAYISSGILVDKFGIKGAVFTYGTAVALLFVVYVIIIIYTNIKKGKGNDE